MKNIENLKKQIGNTPLVKLTNVSRVYSVNNVFYGKLEKDNLTGSVKDRAAYQMLCDAIDEGKIKDDTIIIEPTSGNTGISLAKICKELGLRCVIVMPETMSVERRELIASFGAELVLTQGSLGMKGSIVRAYELARLFPNSFIPMQFDNPSNAKAHLLTTGPEIYRDLKNVDVVVCGVGTGGTITGIAEYFKSIKKEVKVVGVEPSSSRVLEGFPAGPHKIQGIGAGFIPKILNLSLIDEIMNVQDEEAFLMAEAINQKDGYFVGISSGAALAGAIKYVNKHQLVNKNVVIVLPDGGEKYISSGLKE